MSTEKLRNVVRRITYQVGVDLNGPILAFHYVQEKRTDDERRQWKLARKHSKRCY